MDRLEADEEISWAPSREVFRRRVLITALLTFFALLLAFGGVLSAMELPLIWSALGALVITLGFVIEDAARWRSAKLDLWQISGGRLIHEGPEGRAVIPLTDIVSVQRQFGNRVTVKLTSGQRLELRYLPYPAQTAARIDTARQLGDA